MSCGFAFYVLSFELKFMNPEKWEDLKFQIKKQFGIDNEGEETQEGEKETKWIEFNGATGKMRLEYVTKPRVLDVKTIYSKRAGTSANIVKPVVSEDEKVQYLKVYVWKNDNWEEIKTEL